jgi:hypothetical protein
LKACSNMRARRPLYAKGRALGWATKTDPSSVDALTALAITSAGFRERKKRRYWKVVFLGFCEVALSIVVGGSDP